METIQLKKVKIVDNTFLEVEYIETVKTEFSTLKTEVRKVYRQNVHEDLINASNDLIIHLAALCELITDREQIESVLEEYEGWKLNELSSRLSVTQVVWGGSDEHAGITLVGRKKLLNKRILNLVAPFTKFDDENDPYGYMHELVIALDKFSDEVFAYMQEGKCAPNPQQEIDFEEAA